MLLFPLLLDDQKLSVNLPCATQREITLRQTLPAAQRIILQGGEDETTPLKDCPRIGLHLAHIRHPIVRDECCDAGREWYELMNHIHIVHGTSPRDWLHEFVSNPEEIIRGESEDWQLRRVEIGTEDIVLRYSNGEISGDAVLDGFRGRIYFDAPMYWKSDERRVVAVEMEEDKHGGRSVEIKSDLPCELREDKACLLHYGHCVCVKLRLVRATCSTNELTRYYLYSELDERAIKSLTDHGITFLLGIGGLTKPIYQDIKL